MTQSIHEVGIQLLRENAEVEVLNLEVNTSQEVIAEFARDVDAIVTRLSRISEEVIEASMKLRVIGKHGAGYDNIDVEVATRRGIPVVYTPYAPAESVANHVMGLILALAKGIVLADRRIREDPDTGWKFRYIFTGDILRGKVLGLIGLGRIGFLVAKFAKAFGMEIAYYDAVRKQDLERLLDIRYISLTNVLETSDFISISVPLTEGTRGLIGETELNLMKGNAYLINTSRGAIVNEEALCKHLMDKKIAGAALDVYAQEPISSSNPLLRLENVVLTPHMAAHTNDFFMDAARTVAEDVLRVLRGEKPIYVANPQVYSE